MQKPKWFEIAEGEIGTKEVDGGGNNPRILEYHACTTLKATEDSVAWCAAFVNWCLYHSGVMGTRLANARSFLSWGVPLETPVEGCIVIFRRGASPTAGHVAFFGSRNGEFLRVLGGNQGDQVKYSNYPAKDVLGYRWPKEVPVA